jgi:tRNA threonylcarbamoyl adenosine modification protein YeaZ
MPKFDLIIDTSIFGAAVAIAVGDGKSRKIVFSEVTPDVQDSARQLPLLVEDGIKQAGLNIGDIGRIVVSQGPGSFTGIRVGLAYAYGFLRGLISGANPYATMAGVSSLELLAAHWSSQLGQDVVVFLPSTKTTGYAAKFEKENISLHPVDLAKGLHSSMIGKFWCILGSWDGLLEVAAKNKTQSFQIMEPKENARLALGSINDRLAAESGLVWSADMPNAIYLRKSTVEEKAEATN